MHTLTGNDAATLTPSVGDSLQVQNGHNDYLAGFARSDGGDFAGCFATGVVFAVVLFTGSLPR